MLNVKYGRVFHNVIFCLFAKDVIDLCDLDLWPKKYFGDLRVNL